MDDKGMFKENLGAGMEPIPEPDKSEAGREGFNALDEIVGGIMDNLQMTLTGDEDTNPDSDRKNINDKK
ncbi:hypothetical protein [Paenibacillus wynnii]|uniref:hypothetical protein n=1 Tax=Paenibacillus wynnii TaxID=268407 RepID=UPI0027923D6D|nr:hypothetical protein [Paenibacillus wynnii]MDQ0196893.1 hypothetical protein [Paenibacillus wynnii]